MCLRQCPNRVKLVARLRASKTCLLTHLAHRLRPDPIEALESAEAHHADARVNRKGRRQLSHARQGIRTLLGPLRPRYMANDGSRGSSNRGLSAALETALPLPIRGAQIGGGIGRLIRPTA